ncbi:hypothetical protein HCN44_003552 [Aphidius gifuensis]|uniref:Uncharacterized protein n=1 Tax=Aphidius gifuensis TaxID=684658 RepID=A0A835CKD1_APHGI|nr:hypothetical protein HCN44_003552 [Aphidius gifuensis]
METTYNPEVEECTRKEEERRIVHEGTVMWKRRKEELKRQKHREQHELRQMQVAYSPWGKPGGGAKYEGSLRKKNVHLEPLTIPKTSHCTTQGWTTGSLISRLQRQKLNKLGLHDPNEFFNEPSRPITSQVNNKFDEMKNKINEESQIYKLTGGIELVPLLTKKKLNSNTEYSKYLYDATRPGYTIDNLRSLNIGNREHINELTKQIQRKRESALREQRVEQESCRRHFDTWNKLWGRPGHGAPIDHFFRTDLHDILYRSIIY